MLRFRNYALKYYIFEAYWIFWVPNWNFRSLFTWITSELFFFSTNYTGKRTHHIDAKYHFLPDYVEDGTIKIQFVSTDENIADIFTKSPTTELFKKNRTALLDNIGYRDDQVSGGVSK